MPRSEFIVSHEHKLKICDTRFQDFERVYRIVAGLEISRFAINHQPLTVETLPQLRLDLLAIKALRPLDGRRNCEIFGSHVA